MPEAIATTKRKFYKALDALTSGNSTTSPTSGTKRASTAAVAFDEARERARKRLRQSTSTTSLAGVNAASVLSLPRTAPAGVKDAASKTPPNFSPWSQEAFLARLKTFSSVSLWHPKPDALNEVEWAKRGWVCVHVNTVACKGGCERRLLVSLEKGDRQVPAGCEAGAEGDIDPDEESTAFEEALTARYKAQIVEGHSSSCLWYKAGCKDDIYRLSVVRPSVWQLELPKRLRSLVEIGSSIQNVKTRPLESSSERLLLELPREIICATDSTSSISHKAFEIAMHGWRGSSESGNDLLHCDACFQRIGLWMYQPDYRCARRVSDAVDDGRGHAIALIDLVEMHRDYCPWRNPVTQKATGSLSGLNACQILHKVVSTCARDHRRRSHEVPESRQNLNVGVDEDEQGTQPLPKLSREEIAQQDKERESRMRRLKNLFQIKRRSTPAKSPV